MARRTFTSKHGAQNMRDHSWSCIKCNTTYKERTEFCHSCHSPVQYFASKAELRRFRALKLEQRAGLISNLELQPSYPVVINGEKITTYRADFIYTRDEQRVVEDVKGTLDEKYLDPVFKLKRKLIEAVYGITINIVK